MILRRVIHHVRKQEWTAIWIDLVIVVVGVFIGIQVSNWNAEREENRRAAKFSERLRADVLKEAWGYEYLVVYSRETNRNQRRVLDVMAGEASLTDEQFLINAYRATQYKYNDRFRATYDELISTGTIGLIKDQELRETAGIIFTSPLFDTISKEGGESEYRRLFRETVSAEIQEALLSRCGDRYAPVLDYAAIPSSLDYPCTLGISPDKVARAAAALKAMPRFVSALQLRFADNQTALTDLEVNNKAVVKNLQSIMDRNK